MSVQVHPCVHSAANMQSCNYSVCTWELGWNYTNSRLIPYSMSFSDNWFSVRLRCWPNRVLVTVPGEPLGSLYI